MLDQTILKRPTTIHIILILRFHIVSILDDDGKELYDQGGIIRFLEARNGDYLLISLQCKLFDFWNIYGREPESQIAKTRIVLLFFKKS